jgi:hypothetical protein
MLLVAVQQDERNDRNWEQLDELIGQNDWIGNGLCLSIRH